MFNKLKFYFLASIMVLASVRADHNIHQVSFSPNNQTYPYGAMLVPALKNLRDNADYLLSQIKESDNPMPWISFKIWQANDSLDAVYEAYKGYK